MIRRLLAIVVVLLIGVMLWVGIRGFLAVQHAQDAADGVRQIQRSLQSGDVEGARDDLASVQDHTSAAVSLTSDPIWDAVAAFPWGGQNLRAVHATAAASNHVAQAGLPELLDAAGAIDDFREGVHEGDVDTSRVNEALAGVQELEVTLREAQQRILSVDRDYLAPQIGDVLTRLTDAMELADEARESVDLPTP